MKIFKHSTLVIFCFLMMTQVAQANHLLGGELGYQYIATNGTTSTYKVTLTLYGDCASNTGPDAAFAALDGATPMIMLYNGNSLVTSQNLLMNPSLSNVEITPVCPDEAGNTTCSNISNPIPGIRKYVYEGDFAISGTSTNWKFAFEGSVSPNTSAGRSQIIGNANVLGGSSIMYLSALLNNTLGDNSTPTFTSLPTPFFCNNKEQNYSLGAVDPDGDIMNFTLTPAKQLTTSNTSNPTNISYIPPYTATNPIPTASGDFTFNSSNGQMTFTPNQVLNCLVVNTVNEYRNGTLIGTSMREMDFVILSNCNNDAPVGTISNTQNIIINNQGSQQVLELCKGQTLPVSFDINSTDPNGDNITLQWNNLPTGATMNVQNNGTTQPTLHFNWVPTGIATGIYTFYITYIDDGCPLASTQTIAYSINILGVDSVVDHRKACSDDMPYTWNGQTIAQGGDSIASFLTTSHITGCDSLSILSLEVNNDTTVIDSVVVCPYDMPYTWNGILVTSPGVGVAWYNTNSILTGCDSTVSLYLKIASTPTVGINIGNLPVDGFCIRDSILTLASGAEKYIWSNTYYQPLGNADSLLSILPESENTIRLTGIDSNGCIDSTSINVVALPCCTLLMPNAFSPNNDGHNDVFGPVTNGHPQDYQFQVYNRWGQRIFVSFKEENKWDGTIDGKPAPNDTYFYILNGKCANGEPIHQKGDITLLR